MSRMILIAATAACIVCGASAATYTINPPAGTTTNVTQKYTGKNALTINTATPPESGGTVYLNSANTHSSGTTLKYGTLVIQTPDASELGSGTFTQNAGGTLRYAGPANGEWSKTLKGGRRTERLRLANRQRPYGFEWIYIRRLPDKDRPRDVDVHQEFRIESILLRKQRQPREGPRLL